ncbi:unnamed protein product [Amoebophrya sp. A120]|nr:unnamed protein product [Amoebophrya sp. A120]|eukprot:GSA120T00025811001.1
MMRVRSARRVGGAFCSRCAPPRRGGFMQKLFNLTALILGVHHSTAVCLGSSSSVQANTDLQARAQERQPRSPVDVAVYHQPGKMGTGDLVRVVQGRFRGPPENGARNAADWEASIPSGRVSITGKLDDATYLLHLGSPQDRERDTDTSDYGTAVFAAAHYVWLLERQDAHASLRCCNASAVLSPSRGQLQGDHFDVVKQPQQQLRFVIETKDVEASFAASRNKSNYTTSAVPPADVGRTSGGRAAGSRGFLQTPQGDRPAVAEAALLASGDRGFLKNKNSWPTVVEVWQASVDDRTGSLSTLARKNNGHDDVFIRATGRVNTSQNGEERVGKKQPDDGQLFRRKEEEDPDEPEKILVNSGQPARLSERILVREVPANALRQGHDFTAAPGFSPLTLIVPSDKRFLASTRDTLEAMYSEVEVENGAARMKVDQLPDWWRRIFPSGVETTTGSTSELHREDIDFSIHTLPPGTLRRRSFWKTNESQPAYFPRYPKATATPLVTTLPSTAARVSGSGPVSFPSPPRGPGVTSSSPLSPSIKRIFDKQVKKNRGADHARNASSARISATSSGAVPRRSARGSSLSLGPFSGSGPIDLSRVGSAGTRSDAFTNIRAASPKHSEKKLSAPKIPVSFRTRRTSHKSSASELSVCEAVATPPKLFNEDHRGAAEGAPALSSAASGAARESTECSFEEHQTSNVPAGSGPGALASAVAVEVDPSKKRDHPQEQPPQLDSKVLAKRKQLQLMRAKELKDGLDFKFLIELLGLQYADLLYAALLPNMKPGLLLLIEEANADKAHKFLQELDFELLRRAVFFLSADDKDNIKPSSSSLFPEFQFDVHVVALRNPGLRDLFLVLSQPDIHEVDMPAQMGIISHGQCHEPQRKNAAAGAAADPHEQNRKVLPASEDEGSFLLEHDFLFRSVTLLPDDYNRHSNGRLEVEEGDKIVERPGSDDVPALLSRFLWCEQVYSGLHVGASRDSEIFLQKHFGVGNKAVGDSSDPILYLGGRTQAVVRVDNPGLPQAASSSNGNGSEATLVLRSSL